jgi:hypothetical protein
MVPSFFRITRFDLNWHSHGQWHICSWFTFQNGDLRIVFCLFTRGYGDFCPLFLCLFQKGQLLGGRKECTEMLRWGGFKQLSNRGVPRLVWNPITILLLVVVSHSLISIISNYFNNELPWIPIGWRNCLPQSIWQLLGAYPLSAPWELPQTRRQEAKTSDSSVNMACHGDQFEEWPNKMFAQYVDIIYLYIKIHICLCCLEHK